MGCGRERRGMEEVNHQGGNEERLFLSFTFPQKKASLRHSALNVKWLGATHCPFIASLSDAFCITNGVVH